MINELHAARFWAKVEKTADCWIWQGNKVKTSAKGNLYGRMSIGPKGANKLWYAHILSVVIDGREIPPGYEVDHLCFNTLCVRPDHLEVVTAKENRARANKHYGPQRQKTHCIKGHAYTGAKQANGANVCRQCERERYAAKRR